MIAAALQTPIKPLAQTSPAERLQQAPKYWYLVLFEIGLQYTWNLTRNHAYFYKRISSVLLEYMAWFNLYLLVHIPGFLSKVILIHIFIQ